MTDRLDKLCFLPPPVDAPWTGPPPDRYQSEIRGLDGREVLIDLPLFWFEPPWHHVSAFVADQIAATVSELGVLVSALSSDLSDQDEASLFCEPFSDSDGVDDDDDSAGESADGSELKYRPRILPYRAERYGFHPRDLAGPRIIDVRLSIARDRLGHFGYSPSRIERWESTPADQPLAGGGWVPAGSFLPDVPSLSHLDAKLNQLRELAPQAAIFVSFSSHRLNHELPAILATQPDGVILRLDDVPLTGMQLARVTSLARRVMNDSNAKDTPLWVVPGPINADDAAKLLALGASAVAIDHWCEEVIEAAETNPTSLSVAGYNPMGVENAVVKHVIEEKLQPKLDRFKGLCSSMQSIGTGQRLASLSGSWAKALGIPTIGVEDG